MLNLISLIIYYQYTSTRQSKLSFDLAVTPVTEGALQNDIQRQQTNVMKKLHFPVRRGRPVRLKNNRKSCIGSKFNNSYLVKMKYFTFQGKTHQVFSL